MTATWKEFVPPPGFVGFKAGCPGAGLSGYDPFWAWGQSITVPRLAWTAVAMPRRFRDMSKAEALRAAPNKSPATRSLSESASSYLQDLLRQHLYNIYMLTHARQFFFLVNWDSAFRIALRN